MATVDVPMYLRRWKENKESVRKGKVVRTMSSLEAVNDAWSRRVVTKNWEFWREETLWLTGYFSGAVWLSLLFIHIPVS